MSDIVMKRSIDDLQGVYTVIRRLHNPTKPEAMAISLWFDSPIMYKPGITIFFMSDTRDIVLPGTECLAVKAVQETYMMDYEYGQTGGEKTRKVIKYVHAIIIDGDDIYKLYSLWPAKEDGNTGVNPTYLKTFDVKPTHFCWGTPLTPKDRQELSLNG